MLTCCLFRYAYHLPKIQCNWRVLLSNYCSDSNLNVRSLTELLYNLFLQNVYIVSLFDMLLATTYNTPRLFFIVNYWDRYLYLYIFTIINLTIGIGIYIYTYLQL